jgi:hypothetical protein
VSPVKYELGFYILEDDILHNFFVLHRVHIGLSGNPVPNPIDIRSSSQRLKRQKCEADLSPPPSGEIKNSGALPPVTHTPSWLHV